MLAPPIDLNVCTASFLDSRRMRGLEGSADRIAAETDFSGVVRVDRGEDVQFFKAYGLAHRGARIANTVDTQFGIASGTKGLTALTVVSLIEEGRLDLTTTARSVLRDDLPLIDENVTVEHLLAHRSGIGDYFDEEVDRPITDHVLAVPVHELDTTERYLRVLDGHPSKFPPDGGSPTATAATSCSHWSRSEHPAPRSMSS
jgi:CubicO group peptidase (beta-lactamase class C family)